MDAVSTLLLRTISNDGGELDQGWLISDSLGILDGLLNGLKIIVTILDPLGVPSVGLEAGENIFSERDVGVTVDGDVVVIIDGNEVAELEMSGQRDGFSGNTLLQTTVSKECVGMVVEEWESVAVEGGTSLGLGDSETDGVADTCRAR